MFERGFEICMSTRLAADFGLGWALGEMKGCVHVSYMSFDVHGFPFSGGFGYFDCTFFPATTALSLIFFLGYHLISLVYFARNSIFPG